MAKTKKRILAIEIYEVLATELDKKTIELGIIYESRASFVALKEITKREGFTKDEENFLWLAYLNHLRAE